MSDVKPHQKEQQKRSLGVRIANGLIGLAFVFLLGSFLWTRLIQPAFSFWEKIFLWSFGEMEHSFFGFVPGSLVFILFAIGSTLFFAIVMDSSLNSRLFAFVQHYLDSIPFLGHTFSLMHKVANAYRNLKRAKSALVKISGGRKSLYVPTAETRKRVFRTKDGRIVLQVLYCPHTPWLVSGNTLYEMDGDGPDVIHVSGEDLIEDVVGGGIVGTPEEIKEELENGQSQ